MRLLYFKQHTGHTHNTRTTTQPNTRTKHTTKPLSSDLRLRDDGACHLPRRVNPLGGRAEISMGSRVDVRRALARARVRRAAAGPLRPCQLEASRGHAGKCVYHEHALVCLSNREIVDASRGRTFHCKMVVNRCFL